MELDLSKTYADFQKLFDHSYSLFQEINTELKEKLFGATEQKVCPKLKLLNQDYAQMSSIIKELSSSLQSASLNMVSLTEKTKDLEKQLKGQTTEAQEASNHKQGSIKLFSADKSDQHEDPHISIVFKTLFDLSAGGAGWKVNFRDEALLENLKAQKIVTLGVLGAYDAGKTHLCNLLGSKSLRSGHQYTTAGIEVVYPVDKDTHFGIIDVQGSQEAHPINDKELIAKLPLKEKENEANADEETKDAGENDSYLNRFNLLHSDAKLTHSLKEKFIVENVGIILLVTNKLSESDQEMIYKNINYYREATSKRKKAAAEKYLYIIHNFKMLNTIEDVEKQIEKDIINCFEVEKCPMFNTKAEEGVNNFMYKDQYGVCHLVLASDGSPAGKYYNPATIDFLKSRIRNTETRATLDPIKAFQDFCNVNLSKMLGQDFKIEYDKTKSAYVNNNKSEIKIDGIAWTSLGELKLSDSKFIPRYSMTTRKLNEYTQEIDVDLETIDCELLKGENPPIDKSYLQAKIEQKDGFSLLKLSGRKVLSKRALVVQDMEKSVINSNKDEANVELGELVNYTREEGPFQLSIKLAKNMHLKEKNSKPMPNGITRFTFTFTAEDENEF